jgi:hypothetical protein
VPDPGGPFSTTVPANKPIGSLGLVEVDTLCRDVAKAYYSFLNGAVKIDSRCRVSASLLAQEEQSDPLLDGGGFTCDQAYDECVHAEPPTEPFMCWIPIPSDLPVPQQCDATVGDVSACINEIGALDPLGACVTGPACDGGTATASAPPPASALPACARLYRICPALQNVAAFPC